MTGRTEARLRAIRRRTRARRRRLDRRACAALAMLSLLLLTGIGTLLRSVQGPGLGTVAGGSGALLLRSGAGAYVTVGVAAFALGDLLAVLCIRRSRHPDRRTDRAEERDELL